MQQFFKNKTQCLPWSSDFCGDRQNRIFVFKRGCPWCLEHEVAWKRVRGICV